MEGSLAIWGGAAIGLVVGLALWLVLGTPEYILAAMFLGLVVGILIDILVSHLRK